MFKKVQGNDAAKSNILESLGCLILFIYLFVLLMPDVEFSGDYFDFSTIMQKPISGIVSVLVFGEGMLLSL